MRIIDWNKLISIKLPYKPEYHKSDPNSEYLLDTDANFRILLLNEYCVFGYTTYLTYCFLHTIGQKAYLDGETWGWTWTLFFTYTLKKRYKSGTLSEGNTTRICAI